MVWDCCAPRCTSICSLIEQTHAIFAWRLPCTTLLPEQPVCLHILYVDHQERSWPNMTRKSKFVPHHLLYEIAVQQHRTWKHLGPPPFNQTSSQCWLVIGDPLLAPISCFLRLRWWCSCRCRSWMANGESDWCQGQTASRQAGTHNISIYVVWACCF